MWIKDKLLTKKFWISVVRDVTILLFVLSAVSLYQSRNLPKSMPDFEAQLISGEVVNIKQMLKKSPVIIYFWGSWCPMCRFTSPTISALSKNYPVLSIALSSGDKQEVLSYLKENAYDFAVINDADGEISAKWNVMVTPTIFIINDKGIISSAMVGVTSSWGIKIRYWLDTIL